MSADTIFVIYKNGKLWTGERGGRKVRAYQTVGMAQGIVKKEVAVDARRKLRDTDIDPFSPAYDKEKRKLESEIRKTFEIKTFVGDFIA